MSKKHKVHKRGQKGRKEKREDDEEDIELLQEKMAAMASLGGIILFSYEIKLGIEVFFVIHTYAFTFFLFLFCCSIMYED